MNPTDPPAEFVRDTGCTEAEWLGWLPGAVGSHSLELRAGAATVHIGAGRLELRWHALPPRRLAQITLPRLEVAYRFEGVEAAERAAFQRYFDLYMQRGGG